MHFNLLFPLFDVSLGLILMMPISVHARTYLFQIIDDVQRQLLFGAKHEAIKSSIDSLNSIAHLVMLWERSQSIPSFLFMTIKINVLFNF